MNDTTQDYDHEAEAELHASYSDTAQDEYEGTVKATPGPWEPTYIPVELDPLVEIGRMLEGGGGRVYYVCAPRHPDSGPGGVTVIAITGNGPAAYDNATLIACVPEMLEALKLVYRKHCQDDASIGWEEVGDKLGDALINAMGPTGYYEWLQELASND